jgi:hypothetical protein
MNLLSGLVSLVTGACASSVGDGIDQLQADRQATQAALRGSSERRRALMLSDAPDDQIAAIDKVIDGYHLTLERLELKEGVLIAQMQHAGRQ